MKKILISILAACSLVSAQATLFQYSLTFSDQGEANPSTGTGSGTVGYDSSLHTLALSVTFSGLQGTTTAAHIHAPTAVAGTGNASVATTTPTFALFPLGVSFGTFNNTLDLTQASSWNPSFITGNGGSPATAETAFAAFMATGRSYFNIHSTYSPGGEIRAFVPEPSSLALAGLGIIGMAARAWNKRRASKG